MLYTKTDEEEKQRLMEEQEKLEQELERMENRKEYLHELATKKKEIGKSIRNIDSYINDSKLLKEEFQKRNSNLTSNQKIFSLSDFTEILIQQRENLMAELKEHSRAMEPMNYVSIKSAIAQKVDILRELDLSELNEDRIYEMILLLQQEFFKAFEKKLKAAMTKKDILDLIYEFRYYKMIPIKEDVTIKDTTTLMEGITRIEKRLITKACKLRAVTILSNDINKNFELISNLLSSKIIDLDEVVVQFKKKEDKTILTIYEDNLIDIVKEYDYIEDLNVKYNRKIKIFLS